MPGGPTVRDEVWIATALLHLSEPWRPSFRAREIVDRVVDLEIVTPPRRSLPQYVYQHGVANKRADPITDRVLYATADRGRRLATPMDNCHPTRGAGRLLPTLHGVPPQYRALFRWYVEDYVGRRAGRRVESSDGVE